jgi:hypothetical protein
MEYPWWTVAAVDWGFREADCLHCADCAIALGHALERELTDFEINQLGGVKCGRCGRSWPAIYFTREEST